MWGGVDEVPTDTLYVLGVLTGCPVLQVTKDITELSAAAFLKEIGKKCPVTARLSTVVHERGYAIHALPALRSTGVLLCCCHVQVSVMLRDVAGTCLTPQLRRSPESLRDVRGFSVKFYTEEGNWDFVGNDIPVRLHLLTCSLNP